MPLGRAGIAAAAAIAVLTGVLGVAATAQADDTAPTPEPTPTTTEPGTTPQPTPEPTPTPTPEPDCRGAADTRTSTARATPFVVCGVVVVSKNHRVTAGYRPALVKVALPRSGISAVRMDAESATHLTQLVAAAKKAGYRIVVRSAYRSHATQRAIYRPGMTLTAPPGASEHQTGLAADLAAKKGKRVIRGYAFGRSAAGKWVARHAAQFGFIIRYPKKRQSITKIPYEPWHVRYVGAEVAAGVVATPTKTLERYLAIR